MADLAQLRKCEEIAGEQKEAVPARVARNNPVLLFLKNLEGFDYERANDCLAKLLNNHYDTIGVLKLASKRDLVEDAGILPGDALRIVAAVRDYVVPRDPYAKPTTSQWGHVSKPVLGGASTSSHDAYRPPALREGPAIFNPVGASESNSHIPSLQSMQQQHQQRVVNQGAALQQEAVKEGKAVNLVAPIQEAVKDAKTPVDPIASSNWGSFVDSKATYSPADSRFVLADPTLPTPWRALVDGKTGFVYYWNPVTNITQFDKPLPPAGPGPSFQSRPPPRGPPPSSVPSTSMAASEQTFPAPISYPHICRLCNAKCISEDHVRTHYNGQRHKTAIRVARETAQTSRGVHPVAKDSAAQAQSIPVSQSLHSCGVCDVWCPSEIVLRSHFNGKKHAQEMERATDSNDNGHTRYLYCSVCDVTSMSKRNLVMHFKGKRHAQNMKEDSESENSSYYSDSEIE